MCGLFGFSGDPKIIDKNLAKAVSAKIKILGLYNIDRGRHSCGVYIDSDMWKGVKEEKLFNDFIQNNCLPLPGAETGNFTVIGHTRHATSGDHTYENAHPFNINDELVIAHNGVIRNAWTLCNKYRINHSQVKVDSKGLGLLIHQEGFKILNEYEGFAALLMTKVDEPNSLYMYRGVSKRYASGKEEEERPLFYLQAEEGIYVSSLEKSLMAISDAETDKIRVVEGNIVHKITNGRMTKSKYPVNRETVNYGVYNTTTTGGSCCVTNTPKTLGVGQQNNNNTGGSNSGGTPDSTTNSRVGNSFTPNPSNSHAQNLADAAKIVPIIFHETLPNRLDRYGDKAGIFFHMGRYWVLDGDEIKVAHGEYYINKKGYVKEAKGKDCNNYYFYEGVMMRNEKCYKSACEDPALKDPSFNFAMQVSLYSEFPVCNSRSDVNTRCRNVGDYAKYRWYHNQKMLGNYGFTPKWCDRNYHMRDGLTHGIASHNNLKVRETCLNVEALQAERTAKGLSAPQSQAPVVLMPPATVTNNIVNVPGVSAMVKQMTQKKLFREENDDQPELTNFYRQYNSIEHARSTFEMVEINAMRYYICDVMMREMSVTPDSIFDDMVDVQLNMFLTMVIDNLSTVADMWDVTEFQDISHYLMVAKENPDGLIFDEVPEKKNVSSDKSTPDINMAVSTLDSVTSGLPWEDVDDDKVDDEPPIIDQAIEKEMAQVPNYNEEDFATPEVPVEGITPNEEREYAFQDIADYLGDVRSAADELTQFEDDDFAQTVASAIYRSVDPLMHTLRELCDRHGEKSLGEYLNKKIEQTIGL